MEAATGKEEGALPRAQHPYFEAQYPDSPSVEKSAWTGACAAAEVCASTGLEGASAGNGTAVSKLLPRSTSSPVLKVRLGQRSSVDRTRESPASQRPLVATSGHT